MKKFYSVLVASLFLMTSAFGQHWCGTEHTPEFMERLEANVKYANEHPEMRVADYDYVPVKFHLVAEDDGVGRIPEDGVYLQLCRLNEMYKVVGLQFYIDEGFNYVDDSAIFNHEQNTAQFKMASIRNGFNSSLNCFLTNSTGSDGVAGYYTPGGDYVVIRKGSLLEENSSTIGHEFGHLLSLSHPHYGWEDEPYTPEVYGETVTITTIGSSQSPNVPVEIMNDPNCLTTGDRICDTPPDYGFTQNGGNGFTCSNPWEGLVKDRNGVLIYTHSDLIMGYNSCEIIKFTEGQIDALNADYIRRTTLLVPSQTEYMKSGYTPDTMEITQKPTLIYPEAFSTVDEFNSVLFDWEPVPNAHSYVLKISGNAEFNIPVDTDEYFMTQLDANGTYTWQVYSVNEIGHCQFLESSNLFFTGDSVNSTNEIDGVNSFSIFPNPSINSTELTISMDLEKELDVELSLLNANGKVVSNLAGLRLHKGSTSQKLDIGNLSAGVYFVQIVSQKGTLTKRVLITK